MCKASDMGVTLMKTDPINLYAGIRETISQTEESGRQVSEARRQQAREYESYIARADEFKQQYGIRSESDARAAATRYVLNNSGVHTVCATINTFDVLEAFIRLSGEKLSSGEDLMLKDYENTLGHYYCRHACGICEPSCPYQVPVNTIMRFNHYYEAQGREKHAMLKFANLQESNVDRCIDCQGHCESACPYRVPVRSLLTNACNNLTLE